MASRKTTLITEATDVRDAVPTTVWFNPTKHHIRVSICMRTGYDGEQRRQNMIVTWAPGERKRLASEYDEAIQQTKRDANGREIICGGKAPMLVREDKPALRVDAAITEDNPTFEHLEGPDAA